MQVSRRCSFMRRKMAKIVLFFVFFSFIQSFTNGETIADQRSEDASTDKVLKLKPEIQANAEYGISKNARISEIKTVISTSKAVNDDRLGQTIGPDTEQKAAGNSNTGLGHFSGENTMESRFATRNAILLEGNKGKFNFGLLQKALLNNITKKQPRGNKGNAPSHGIRHWSSRGHKVFDSLVRRFQSN